jgi:hypothetical protein
MDQNEVQNPEQVPQSSAELGDVRNDSEGFRNVPNGSEAFRVVRNDSEGFRSIPQAVEKTENHTLTVREVARMFEVAGVARTERSVVNWCRPNRQGVARLDAYFDPNERKYYLTAKSVERAIAEEKTKAIRIPEHSETVGTVPKDAETSSQPIDTDRVEELEKEIFDLKITNRAKDHFIDQLQKERESHVTKLMASSHRIGELETKLLQLEAPESISSENAKITRKLEVTEEV